MYRPRYFADADLSGLDQLIARDNFITLITSRLDTPAVTHLPVLYHRDGDRVQLRGHWARPNPQAQHAGPALAIVHGPHAYVSPSWYPDKEEAARVPTWNYAVAHLTGTLETFDDEASLAAVVNDLTVQQERAAGGNWQFEPEKENQRIQLRGIIGFRFQVESIALTFKLNQNHPAANVRNVAAALSQKPDQDAQAIAELMLDRLARREP